MKRNDDNAAGIIKIPDVSAVTASVAQQQQLQQSVYVQRPAHIEMSARPSNVTSGLPRAHAGGSAPGTTGVTVYRSDGASANPPAAHSGGVAVTTTPSAANQQQPPVAHVAQPSMVSQQPPPNLKTEQISKFWEIISKTDCK